MSTEVQKTMAFMRCLFKTILFHWWCIFRSRQKW